MAGLNRSAARREYLGRINRVIDHISAHLGDELTLAALARVAAFSPYHFHRIFSELMAEPLFACIRRLRLERAAGRLLANDDSITAIAFDCGFSSSAVFAREFRRHFGLSASAWRARGSVGNRKDCQAFRKDCQTVSKQGKALPSRLRYDGGRTASAGSTTGKGEKHMHSAAAKVTGKVTVKELPGYRVAYVRHIGPYAHATIGKTWGQLMRWAGPRGLAGGAHIGISHDDPGITPAAKLRYDAGVAVGPEVQPEGDIGIQELKGGQYALCRVTCTPDQISDAFHWLFAEWFPSSGWQCADGPCFELYAPECSDDSFVFDICVPVKPL